MTRSNYEPVERLGASMTGDLPWNRSALVGVERLNGRAGHARWAAIAGETDHGEGIVRSTAVDAAAGCSPEAKALMDAHVLRF